MALHKIKLVTVPKKATEPEDNKIFLAHMEEIKKKELLQKYLYADKVIHKNVGRKRRK